MNEVNPINLVEEKLTNWELTKKSLSEQTEYFANILKNVILEAVLSGDAVESITVHENLYEACSASLSALSLPAEFKDPSGAPWEQSNADFQEYCKTIPVRSAPTGYFAQGTVETLSAASDEQLFIQIMTAKKREFMMMQQYDAQKGITAKLRQSGIPFTPTMNEVRMLILIAALFEVDQPKINEQAVLQATVAPEMSGVPR